MTLDELHRYATTLILTHGRDIPVDTIFDLAGGHLLAGTISTDDAAMVAELISRSKITVDFPDRDRSPASSPPDWLDAVADVIDAARRQWSDGADCAIDMTLGQWVTRTLIAAGWTPPPGRRNQCSDTEARMPYAATDPYSP